MTAPRDDRPEPPPVPFVDVCTETIDGDPDTRIRLPFQIRVF